MNGNNKEGEKWKYIRNTRITKQNIQKMRSLSTTNKYYNKKRRKL
jgi:hypothetical protein